MFNINRKSWAIFFIFSLISILVWLWFSYPQLAFPDFSVNRTKALSISETFLNNAGYKIEGLQKAIIFTVDESTNRYLQKTLGFTKFREFIEDNHFDLFLWVIRYFKENQKEEFRLTISAKTGEVVGFRHTIEETAHRENIERDDSRSRVIAFLQKSFNFVPENYSIKADLKTIYDNRLEYTFAWFKKSVNIPWSPEKNSGRGKLVIGATISGSEILSFYKNSFYVPDDFNRYLEKNRTISQNISTVVRIFYYLLIIASIFFLVVRRNHLAMHCTKKFYLGAMITMIFLSLLATWNHFESILFNYPTATSFDSYLGRFFINSLLTALFTSVAFLIPALAGELLHHETLQSRPQGSFLYYNLSTFFSRHVSRSILLGYFVCIIMLGIQSVMIKFGQTHLGVWVEHSWLDQMTTAYLPFLSALTLGFQASFNEEILYRLFAISWLKKALKNTLFAILVSSLIWGFAHSDYPVYPMWFRGIEVTCLGLFLSFVYLNFGIIPVIIGHFLFDVFWNSTGYLLGRTQPIYFTTSSVVLMLPLIWALFAFFLNKKDVPQPMRWQLNRHQLYNLEILKNYLAAHKKELSQKSREEIRQDIISHGWDVAVVDIALEDW